jgi:hypothetical protein
MTKSKLIKVYKIYRLSNMEDNEYKKVTTFIAKDEYTEYPSEEEAMKVIDSLDSWSDYAILPIIKRVYDWD